MDAPKNDITSETSKPTREMPVYIGIGGIGTKVVDVIRKQCIENSEKFNNSFLVLDDADEQKDPE